MSRKAKKNGVKEYTKRASRKSILKGDNWSEFYRLFISYTSDFVVFKVFSSLVRFEIFLKRCQLVRIM